MVIYKNEEIKVTTIEENDKLKVLEYFSQNTFNANHLDGSLKPSNSQFMQIMDDIINGKDDENNIFVLKKSGKVIGYISMFVEYDRLIIGHIAIDYLQRGRGYGQLLTNLAILIAENENRDVSLHCNHQNSYLRRLGFETRDDIHYLYKKKGITKNKFPEFFVSVEEYRKRKEEENRKELDSYVKFLKSDIMKHIFEQ